MSRGMAAAALAVCVLVAGCGGPFGGGEPTDELTDGTTRDATASGERVIAAPPDTADGSGDAGTAIGGTDSGGTSTPGATGTVTGGTTDSAVTDATATAEPAELTATRRTTGTETRATFDRDVGYEVRVSNAGPTARNVTVRIVAANDSAAAFAESSRVGPNESVTFDVVFPHAGAYEAAVSVGEETATQRWAVESRNPDEALSVHVSESGEVYLGFVAI